MSRAQPACLAVIPVQLRTPGSDHRDIILAFLRGQQDKLVRMGADGLKERLLQLTKLIRITVSAISKAGHEQNRMKRIDIKELAECIFSGMGMIKTFPGTVDTILPGNDKTDIIAESFQQVLCDISGTACNQ